MNKNYFVSVLTASLLICLICFSIGYRQGKRHVSARIVHDTLAICKYIPSYQPTAADTVYLEVPVTVDTAAVIADYFAQKVYVDNVPVEDYGSVTIIDTIHLNGIESRSIEYDLHIPKYSIKNDVAFLAGAFVCKGGLGVTGSMRWKRITISAGYDLINKTPVGALQYEF